MAISFNGTNQSILGTNQFPSIAGLSSYSFGGWFNSRGAANPTPIAFGSDASTARVNQNQTTPVSSVFKYSIAILFSGSLPIWITTNSDGVVNVRQHFIITYDGSSTANDPLMYINGISVAVTESVAPVGTWTNSDTDTIRMGERLNGTNDWDGQIQHFLLQQNVMSVDEINRSLWWGRNRGGLVAYFPFLTGKLVNEGIDAATFTNTNATVSSLVTPVVRPCGNPGMGIGW